MKLLTEELIKRFAEVGSQDGNPDPIVIAKYFNPCGIGTWYITEYDPKERLFFGYCSLFGDYNDEFGYVSLDELESIKTPPFGLGIERDIHTGEKRLSEYDIPSLKK